MAGTKRGWMLWALALALAWCVASPAMAQGSPSMRLAPGFKAMAPGSKLLVLPVDLELFSISAGGVLEPKADWTAQARVHMRDALAETRAALKLSAQDLGEAEVDEHAELVGLHAAVAQSIALHHRNGMWALPTKHDQLLWSFGDAMRPLADRTGARYALFMWVRDSYASAERKAVMVGLALLGVGISGGAQVGYASLVDLHSGEVVWFNKLIRGTGDLRELDPARESIAALLTEFPGRQ